MEILGPALVLGFVLKHVVDWARSVIPDNIEAKVLIPVIWVLAILGSWALSTSAALAKGIEVFPGVILYHADAVVIVVYGFMVAGSAAVFHDLTKPSTPPHDQP